MTPSLVLPEGWVNPPQTHFCQCSQWCHQIPCSLRLECMLLSLLQKGHREACGCGPRPLGSDSHGYHSVSKYLWSTCYALGHSTRCGDTSGYLSPRNRQPNGQQLMDRKCCYVERWEGGGQGALGFIWG